LPHVSDNGRSLVDYDQAPFLFTHEREEPTVPSPSKSGTYLWCDSCRRSFTHTDAPDGACPVCGKDAQAIGKISAILRGLMSNELAPSPIVSKHRQLVKLIWTHNGMGEQYYRVIAPEMSYTKFESAVTEILCTGAEEGWVRFSIPPAPRDDESHYRLELVDEDRFITALEALAGPDAAKEEGT
jgi:hypothetical protein